MAGTGGTGKVPAAGTGKELSAGTGAAGPDSAAPVSCCSIAPLYAPLSDRTQPT